MLKNATQIPAVSALAVDASRAVPAYVGLAAVQHMSAPKTRVQGTAVPFAGLVDDSATPGSPPREAPV